MVRTANNSHLGRPRKHSDDDITELDSLMSPREKRPMPHSSAQGSDEAVVENGTDKHVGRKVAKVVNPPNRAGRVAACNLGAQFRLLGGVDNGSLARQVTPRRAVSAAADDARLSQESVELLEAKQPASPDHSVVKTNIIAENKIDDPTHEHNDDAVEESSNNHAASEEGLRLECVRTREPSGENVPAAGHGVDPKFMTQQTFRSKGADDTAEMAEQLKAFGQSCTPLCSPRRLDRRRQKRAQKRIEADLQDQARPCLSVLHPPCVISGAVYSVLADQYRQRYKENLRELYNQQLEKEVNVERFRKERSEDGDHKSCKKHLRKAGSGRVTGKFSNVSDEDERGGLVESGKSVVV